MIMRRLLFVIGLVVSLVALGQEYLPTNSGEIVKHTYYTLSYSERNEQAEWVYYELTPESVLGDAERSDNFRPDPKVSTVSASLEDYRGSGYDRGHLCPAAAMKLNKLAVSETFYLSNMSPQLPGFNRGIWKTLEATVRAWAADGNLFVVTGPVFNDNIAVIGDGVTVPGYYYKVIYDAANERMIGFLLQHSDNAKSIKENVVPVYIIEAKTGIDFFSQLEDSKEDKLESGYWIEKWNFDEKPVTRPHLYNHNSTSSAVRCNGIAKSTRKQCKIMTKNENGYCRYHLNQAGGD